MTSIAAAISDYQTRVRPRWLPAVVVVLLLMASAVTVTVLSRGSQRFTGDLDPANPGRSGAQGLAHVLSEHAITVIVVRSQRELLDQPVDGATTLAVTGTSRLSRRTAQTALTHAKSAASLVLLDPDHEVTSEMGLPVDPHITNLTDVSAGCRGAELGKDFRLAQADLAYIPRASGLATTTCFPDEVDGGGAMVSLPPSAGRPAVVLLGDESLISNGTILDADNAAIALHLFGHTDRLVWYVPSLADVAAGDHTSRSLAPEWFLPGLALGTSAVVLLCLWRGRRLGPLVTEPLPVVVRAVETTESRGRMYRRARDRTRAVAVLQQATRRRLASSLGLSTSSTVSSVAAASAAVSGRDYLDVLRLLETPAVHDDSSLLHTANSLLALEKEVRRI